MVKHLKSDWISPQSHVKQSQAQENLSSVRETLIQPVLSIYALKSRAKKSSEPLYPFWWGHEEFESPTSHRQKSPRDIPSVDPIPQRIHAAGKASTRDGIAFEPVRHLPCPKKMIDEMIQTDSVQHSSFPIPDPYLYYTDLNHVRNQQSQTSPELEQVYYYPQDPVAMTEQKQPSPVPAMIRPVSTLVPEPSSAIVSDSDTNLQRQRQRPRSPSDGAGLLWIPLNEHDTSKRRTPSPPKRIQQKLSLQKTRVEENVASAPSPIDKENTASASNVSRNRQSRTPSAQSRHRVSGSRTHVTKSPAPTPFLPKTTKSTFAESPQPPFNLERLAVPKSMDPLPPFFDKPDLSTGIYEIVTQFLNSQVLDCLDLTHLELEDQENGRVQSAFA